MTTGNLSHSGLKCKYPINMLEFQNKELKKRTRCIKVFFNKESLLVIATALMIELDESLIADSKVYLKG